jgi:hypothetical protein
VEHIAEIVWKGREIADAHVERYRCDAGIRQSVPVRLPPQPRSAPDLIALGERTRDGEGDLARRSGDQDLF